MKASEWYSDEPHMLEMLSRCFSEGTTIQEEIPWRMRTTGEVKHFAVTFTYVPPDLVVHHAEDITERKRAEKGVRFQAKLLDVVGQAVIATDSQGKVIYWNKAAENLYGWAEEEVMGHSILEIIPSEEMLDRAEEIMAELMAGRSWSGEFEVRRKDGTTFPVMVTDTPLHDEQGNLMAIIGVSTDITEIKQTEELLRSEERFRLLVEGVKDYAIFMLDPEGRITSWNAGAERIKGYSAEEILGQHFSRFYTERDVECDHPEEELCIAQEQGRYEEEGWRVRKDGSRFWASVLITALRDGEGSLRGFAKVVRDMTERKRAEETLRYSEERFRSLVENSSDYIAIVAEDAIRYVSPSVERVLGYRPEELIGGNVLNALPQDDLERALSIRSELLKKPGLHPPFEFQVPHKDGSLRYLENTLNNLMDDPAVKGIVVNSRDITERKKAEQALKESEERFRSTFEEASIGMAVGDLEGRLLQVNRSLCEMLGYSEEELLATTFQAVTHPDNLEAELDHVRRMLKGEINSFQMEKRYLDSEGHVVWGSLNASVVRDQERHPLYLIGQVQDITERKKFEQEIAELSQRNELILNSAGEGILGFDKEGRITFANPAAATILGWEVEELIGRIGHPTMHHTKSDGTLYPREECPIHISIKDGISRRATDEVFWRKDGRSFFTEYTCTPVARDEEIVGAVLTFSDVTERKQAEAALRESEEFFRALYEKVYHPIFLVDKELNFIDVNPYACEFYGYSREEFRQMKVSDLTIPEDLATQQENAEELRQHGEMFVPERRLRKKNGEVVTVSVDIATVTRAGQELYVGKITDITERKEAEKRLRYQATHDLLTDLPNRHLFTDRLKRALRLTRRRRGRKIAVLYLDLDNFKVVNDSWGHEVGDGLLMAVGERLRWCLRPEDTLARFGGDEFAVLLEEVEAPSDVAKVAERIVERFREPLVMEGREFVIRVSIGIALGTARQTTAEDLLRDADTAMYQAKGQDDDYRVFDPAMYEQALRRLKLEGDLKRAIEDEAFLVCYQPIVGLDTGETSGVEALVRWEHPERQGLVATSQFISVAEDSGLVVPMGRWVLEEACLQGVRWQQEHPHIPPLVMSVNLSAKQLQHPDVAETVEKTLKETGFDARCLSLDITETLYIEALEGNTAALDKLKEMGVRISIDDFGTGYSSLAYLKRLPADILKIDKSFIKGIGEDLEDTAIVKMIIELAHTLGMEVIAEGVESEEQAEQLKEMGCDLGQGFYFATPLSPIEATTFLSR